MRTRGSDVHFISIVEAARFVRFPPAEGVFSTPKKRGRKSMRKKKAKVVEKPHRERVGRVYDVTEGMELFLCGFGLGVRLSDMKPETRRQVMLVLLGLVSIPEEEIERHLKGPVISEFLKRTEEQAQAVGDQYAPSLGRGRGHATKKAAASKG